MQTNRTHINPIVGDKITFLKTARETGGRSSLLQLELAPLAQGTPPHYHERFTETFTIQEGELMVRCGGELRKLGPGQSFRALVNTKHCFFNAKKTAVKALIELNPGSEGFENGIKIAYGLARDGQCNPKGLPKRLDHMALLFVMSEGRMPGLLSFMMPIFRMIARRARAKGVEKKLI